MKRMQFSEERIIGILKEAEAGAVVTEPCRKDEMSSGTYYAWILAAQNTVSGARMKVAPMRLCALRAA